MINLSRLTGISFFKSRGLLWVGGVNVLEKLIHLSTFLGLSLWLVPEDYGVFALAWVLIAIGDSFFGLGSAFGYMRERENPKAKEIFNGAAFLFAAFWSTLCVIAGCIIFLWGAKEVGQIVCFLAIPFICRGFTYGCATTFALNQNYRLMSTFQLAPALLGGVAGIFTAIEGGGVWALVIRYIVAGIAGCFVIAFLSPYTHRIIIDIERIVLWLRDGWRLAVSNNIGWLVVYQIEQVVIGAAMGPAILGLYNFARKPADIAGQVLDQVGKQFFLPHYIREASSSLQAVKSALLLALVCALGALCIMVVAEFLLINFWSESWLPVAALLPVSLLLIPLAAIDNAFKSFLAAAGDSSKILSVTIFSSILSVFLLFACVQMGLGVVYILWAAILSMLIKVILFMYFVLKVKVGSPNECEPKGFIQAHADAGEG